MQVLSYHQKVAGFRTDSSQGSGLLLTPEKFQRMGKADRGPGKHPVAVRDLISNLFYHVRFVSKP